MRVIAMDSLSPISESFVNFAKTGRVYLLRIKVSPQEAFSKLDGKIGRNKIVSLSDPSMHACMHRKDYICRQRIRHPTG